MSAIDLSKLPVIEIIARKNFEAILSEKVTELVRRAPELRAVANIESDPLIKLMEACAYREMLVRAEFDDAVRGQMLAFARAADLDHLGALPFYKLSRLVLQEADDTVSPPIPRIMESDEAFRSRIQLALDGASAAGPGPAYELRARSAHGGVLAAHAASPTPGHVIVYVLAAGGSAAPAEVLQAVTEQLTDEAFRQLCATVEVRPAQIINYALSVDLTLLPGPDQAVVIAAVRAAIERRVAELYALGRDVTISALHQALHQQGVQEVTITSPAARIEVDAHQAAYCTGITINVAGRDV